MSRARHKHKAMGSGVKPVWNAGGEQNAAKEAEERRHGGRTHGMHGEGHAAKHRADHKKRASGGAVPARADGGAVPARAHGGKVHGHHRGRAKGGGIGANLKPLSTAATIHEVTKGEQSETANRSN